MYDFLLQTIFFSSIAFVIYLMARALPRVQDQTETTGTKPDYFGQMMKKLPLEKVDSAVNSFLSKLLRKLKIVILKIDNLVNKLLNRTKKAEKNNNSLLQVIAQPEKPEEGSEENRSAQ